MRTRPLERHSFTSPNGTKIDGLWRERSSDYNTFHSIVADDEYMLSVLAQSGKTVVDIGAHIGAVTCFCAARGMNVVAVEPLPENIELLRINLSINNLRGVKIIEAALTGKTGDLQTIWYGDVKDHSGESDQFIGRPFPHIMSDKDDFAIVDTVSFIDVMKEVDECSLLKIDCEGSEWEAFADIPNETLDKIEITIAELHAVPGSGTKKDFVDMFRGRLVEVADYGRFLPSSNEICHVMLKRSDITLESALLDRLAALEQQYGATQ